MKKQIAIIMTIAIISIAIFAAGCTDNEKKLQNTTNSSANAGAKDELIAAVGVHGGEPEGGFDPITGWGQSSEPLIQSTLFKRDSKANLVNDLATNYTVSPDGLTWIVKIRDGVKFHDGSVLSAKDVAFTFNTAAKAAGSTDLSVMEKASVINDNTVEFKLKEYQNTFINKLIALGIVPENGYTGNYGQKPIGSGPYKFVQWDKGQQVIMQANPDYYGQKPYFKKLTIVYMNADTAFAAAKAHKVDIAEIPVSYVDQKVDGMKLIALDSIDARGIFFPTQPNKGEKTKDGYVIGNNITSDVVIRKALNIGIDRQALIRGALNGQGMEEFTGVDKLPWGNKEAVFEDGKIETAKNLLTDAGWKDTNGDGIVEKNGQKAEFTILYSAAAQERQALAVALSEEAKKIGIRIKLEGTNWDKIDTLAPSTPVLFGFGTLDQTDLYMKYYSKSYGTGKYNNIGMYNNPTVDNYLRTAITSHDKETAYKNWQLAAWDGKTGFSERGDATWLWMATLKYLYIADNDLDIGTPKIQPHGADIFGNIVEWKRI